VTASEAVAITAMAVAGEVCWAIAPAVRMSEVLAGLGVPD
jgi:hypothetical protein